MIAGILNIEYLRPPAFALSVAQWSDFAKAERIVRGFSGLAKTNSAHDIRLRRHIPEKGWKDKVLDLRRNLDDYWPEKVYRAS